MPPQTGGKARRVLGDRIRMKTKMKPIHYGLIGCGGFGQFCLEAFSGMPEVKIVAVADIDANLAAETAAKYAAKAFSDVSRFVEQPDLDLVHIATPPFLHFPQALLALQAGKHVLCEKPLAVSLAQGLKLVEIARDRGKILPVNFVLRYTPITETVKELIESGILGAPLYASFINNAADENLPAEHWFWDPKRSGEIFVEHGVHFFDLYRYWFGEAVVRSAQAELRPGTSQTDRVFCQMRHPNGVIATHYHGFDQPNCLDRQRHIIIFETGDISVSGWIPQTLHLNGIGNGATVKRLRKQLPASAQIHTTPLPPRNTPLRGRGKNIDADRRIQAVFSHEKDKQELYATALQNLLRDQIRCIHDPAHRRKIDENNGVEALKMAVEATKLTQRQER